MNYKAQLKGWCVDRITELWKVTTPFSGQEVPIRNLTELMRQADILADYAYVPSKDMEDTASYLFDLVRKSPPGEARINALIGTLEHIQSDRYAQHIDTVPENTGEKH